MYYTDTQLKQQRPKFVLVVVLLSICFARLGKQCPLPLSRRPSKGGKVVPIMQRSISSFFWLICDCFLFPFFNLSNPHTRIYSSPCSVRLLVTIDPRFKRVSSFNCFFLSCFFNSTTSFDSFIELIARRFSQCVRSLEE